MANAKKDENGRNTLTAVSSSDGVTIIAVQANPANSALSVSNAGTGSDAGNNGGVAMIDENGVPVMTALSSNGDGTIIEVYADPLTSKLLIKST